MKLNYDLIVFDLEATIDVENGHQRNNFIIDIGAVYLSFEAGVWHTKSQFGKLVRPENEKLSQKAIEITGITDDMLATADTWEVVGQQFIDWAKEYSKNIKNIRLVAFGTYFDVPLLRRMYEKYNMPFSFSGTAIDAKTLALLWLALSGHRSDKCNVDRVASLMGIVPTGKYHRALVDALATAEIVKRVYTDLSEGMFLEIGKGDSYNYLKIIKK